MKILLYGYTKNDPCFCHNGHTSYQNNPENIKFCRGGIKDELNSNENEDNMYIMMEINFVTDSIRFIGPCVQWASNMSYSISNLERPVKIVVGFWTSQPNTIGLGLVKW